MIAADPPAPGPGHNRPPSVPELVDERVAYAEQWLAGVKEIASTVDGDIAANMRGALLELIKQAEAARETEKKPHLDAGRAVDARWKPIVETARAMANKLRAALTPWLRKLEDEKKAQAAQAIAGGASPERADVSARAGGATGKRASLRVQRRAVIRDYDAALAFFKDHPDVRSVVERLANKVAAIDGKVPGVDVVEERVAA